MRCRSEDAFIPYLNKVIFYYDFVIIFIRSQYNKGTSIYTHTTSSTRTCGLARDLEIWLKFELDLGMWQFCDCRNIIITVLRNITRSITSKYYYRFSTSLYRMEVSPYTILPLLLQTKLTLRRSSSEKNCFVITKQGAVSSEKNYISLAINRTCTYFW